METEINILWFLDASLANDQHKKKFFAKNNFYKKKHLFWDVLLNIRVGKILFF